MRATSAAVALCLTLLSAGASQAQVLTFTCSDPIGFGLPLDPGIPLAPLHTAIDPIWPEGELNTDLLGIVVNVPAAIQLGKALFWDMQTTSDGKTACATCHNAAGTDPRTRNQLHPGTDGTWDGHAVNMLLDPADYPFHVVGGADNDDTTGSQGIAKMRFLGIRADGTEATVPIADPVFSAGGVNIRQVGTKNAPSVINAVFNHRNLWNGAAQAFFNGVNSFGTRDPSARLWMVGLLGKPVQVDIRIHGGSLAAQSMESAVDPREMGAIGRNFTHIGKKMLMVKPLAKQQVSLTDSVLGSLAEAPPRKGLKVSYRALIQQAFHPRWWSTFRTVPVGGRYIPMMEANFTLFWGVSIMLYEATLVSDETPFDQYMTTGRTYTGAFDIVAGRLQADLPGATTADILEGLHLFETPQELGGANCILCHAGPELTSASWANNLGLHAADLDNRNAGFDLRMERMFMDVPPVPAGTRRVTFDPATYKIVPSLLNPDGSVGTTFPPASVAIYDNGFYNIGVRPSAEEPGLGGTDGLGNPLSYSRLFKALPDPSLMRVTGETLGCAGGPLRNRAGHPLLAGPVRKNEKDAVEGSFKAASLRNIEFTGPYRHNGSVATLMQAVSQYNRGGDFHRDTNPTLAPLIRPLGLTQHQQNCLVAFMLTLTDERVRWRRAPFDHPQLFVPNGHLPNGQDWIVELPAVGASGSATPIQRFLGLNPFHT